MERKKRNSQRSTCMLNSAVIQTDRQPHYRYYRRQVNVLMSLGDYKQGQSNKLWQGTLASSDRPSLLSGHGQTLLNVLMTDHGQVVTELLPPLKIDTSGCVIFVIATLTSSETQIPGLRNISDQTVRNRLRETGIFPTRLVRRNMLTLRHLAFNLLTKSTIIIYTVAFFFTESLPWTLNSVTSCFGSCGDPCFLNPACAAGERIVVDNIYAPAKPASDNCPAAMTPEFLNQTHCCEYANDCMDQYNGLIRLSYFETFIGTEHNRKLAANQRVSSECGSGNITLMEYSNFMMLNYYCINRK